MKKRKIVVRLTMQEANTCLAALSESGAGGFMEYEYEPKLREIHINNEDAIKNKFYDAGYVEPEKPVEEMDDDYRDL